MTYTLKNIDSEDIGDILEQAEQSFDMKFDNTEFQHVETFGELCRVIKSRVKLVSEKGCTYQQAFYKLRIALAQSGISSEISPQSRFDQLFLGLNRQKVEKSLDARLGFKTKLLRMPNVFGWGILISGVCSFGFLFINWRYALICFAIGVASGIIGFFFKHSLNVITVGDLSRSLTWRYYSKVRRQPGTYNAEELDDMLVDWFAERLGLERSALKTTSRLD